MYYYPALIAALKLYLSSCFLKLLPSFLLLPIIFLLPVLSQGQNWHPQGLGQDHYYELPQGSLYAIRVDSSASSGSDSLFYFNKIAIPSPNGSDPYSYWHPNLLLSGWKQTPTEEITFFSSTGDSVFIFPHAALNTPWAFSTLTNLTAQISSRTFDPIFGVQDSVITILISNGEEFILSQSFGILKTPNLKEMLSGAASPQTLTIAQKPRSSATVVDYYNYQSGDKLVYYDYSNDLYGNLSNNWNQWTYYTVISRTDYPTQDSVSYLFYKESFYRPHSGYPSIDQDTVFITYKDTPNSFVSAASFEYMSYGVSTEAHLLTEINQDSLGRITKTFSLYWDTGIELEQVIADYGHDYFTEGIGFVGADYRGFQTILKRDLVCYKIGNDSMGTCQSFTDLVGRNPAIPETEPLSVWPNPASTFLHVQSDEQGNASRELALLDLYGKTIQSFTLTGSQEIKIPVSHLKPGIYFLRDLNRPGNSRKLLIQPGSH